MLAACKRSARMAARNMGHGEQKRLFCDPEPADLVVNELGKAEIPEQKHWH